MFLLRIAFWLSIVLLLIPADPESGTEAPTVTVLDALVATRSTIADLSHFCERNADVCATGGAAWALLTERAASGFHALIEQFAPADDDGNTLRPEDQEPVWRGPPESSAV